MAAGRAFTVPADRAQPTILARNDAILADWLGMTTEQSHG
jgi:hypothetical protein